MGADATGGIGSGIGSALGGVADIFKIFTGLHQNKLANQIHPNFVPYQSSPYAAAQLGIAEQAYNAPIPGYQDDMRGIQAGQQNVISNISRNATDAGQALALATGTQGQSNNAVTALGDKAAVYKANMLNNLNAGYQAMIEEGNKVNKSELDKFQIDTGQQAALRGAGFNNIAGGINDAASQFSLMSQQKKQDDFNKQLLSLYGGGAFGA